MPFSYDTFLDELIARTAAAASLEYAATPRAIWKSEAVEGSNALGQFAADPYSVLRLYAGGREFLPVYKPAIQVMTVGTSPAAAWAQCQAIFDSLIDAGGLPLRMVSLTHYRILGVFLRPLISLGKDERGRSRVAFNFDCDAVKTTN
jgi:hypothetical protein